MNRATKEISTDADRQVKMIKLLAFSMHVDNKSHHVYHR